MGIVAVIALLLCISKAEDYFKPEDYKPFLQWYRLLAIIGISFYPLCACLFRKFSDKGYFFGKVLGIVISGWLVWCLSSLHIAKFTPGTGYVVLVLCALVNYGLTIYLCSKKKISIGKFLGITDGSGAIMKALWYEVLFFLVFALLLYIKCFRPDFCWTTEGPTNYGFMMSMMKSEYMPPEDCWYSGTSLNYYYFGQFLATYLTKLSGVTAGYGYNLALMMTAALCAVMVYALVAQIFELYMKERVEEFKKRGKRTVAEFPVLQGILPGFAGLVSGCAVTFCATCHYWIYAKVVPIVYEIMGLGEAPSFWFPDSTRYIGHQGEALDQTIHEFPAYSFVLGDLHAHVTNIIYVLLLLAILYAWLLQRRDRMKAAVAGVLEPVSYKAELLQPNLIVLSFLIGIFQMTNYWDFPIYFVVCGAVILVSNAVICGFTKKTFLLTIVHAAEFIVLSFATSFLFQLHFKSMVNGIGICDRKTVLYQMIIVWGLPILSVIGYLITNIKEEQQRRKEGVTQTEHKNVFFAWLQNLKTSELFLLILGLCAIGLILIPEFVYIRDIYGSTHQRSNTMFKLTYQAFIMFGICMGAIVTRYLFLPKNGKQVVAGGAILFLLYRNVGYYGTAWEGWAGDYKNPENYKGLDCVSITDVTEADETAAKWINEQLEGRPLILEAAGDSFCTDNRISTLTGCPTIIGWHTHEWLWKNDLQAVDARVDDVRKIYTCFDIKKAASFLTKYGVGYDGSVSDKTKEKLKTEFGITVNDHITKETSVQMLQMLGVDPAVCMLSTETVMELLEQYEVDYLYVGKLEFTKYGEIVGGTGLDYDYLRSLGEVVYEDPDSLYCETFIVKVERAEN